MRPQICRFWGFCLFSSLVTGEERRAGWGRRLGSWAQFVLPLTTNNNKTRVGSFLFVRHNHS